MVTPTSTSTPASASSRTMSTAAQMLAASAAANKANAQKIITALGSGSGMDVAALANSLVEAEKAPQANVINSRIAKNDAKVTGSSAVMFMLKALNTALTALKDQNSFNTATVSNSNTSAFNATVGRTALPGSHNVAITALATAQRNLSAGYASPTSALNGSAPFSLQLASTNAGVAVGTPAGASIGGVAFGTQPDVADFKNFSVSVDGVTRNLTPAPATATLADLAANLQAQLRALDGNTDLSVTVSGSTLALSSASSKVISNPSLSLSTTIVLNASGANEGTASGSSINGVAFATTPGINDFSAFNVTVGGKFIVFRPAPATATLADLAANLQAQLRAQDAGSTDLSVITSGSTLTVLSATGRTVTNPGLSKSPFDTTPAGVVAAINAKKAGVTAQLVQTGSSTDPYQIMISGGLGAAKSFSLVSSSLDVSFATSLQTAANASVSVNGVSYSRNSNSISDIISGVMLDLKTTTGSSANLSLGRDSTEIKANINAFVTAYNEANSILAEVSNPKSSLDTFGATMVGDTTIQSIRQQLRSMITGNSSTPGSAVGALWQMGLSTDRSGVMSADATKLDSALQNNFDDVVQTFTGNRNGLSIFSTLPAGLAGDAVKKITNLLSSSGPLQTDSDGAAARNKKNQVDLTALDARMSGLLARYTAQFAAMDSLVGRIKGQQSGLKSSFDGMMSIYTNK